MNSEKRNPSCVRLHTKWRVITVRILNGRRGATASCSAVVLPYSIKVLHHLANAARVMRIWSCTENTQPYTSCCSVKAPTASWCIAAEVGHCRAVTAWQGWLVAAHTSQFTAPCRCGRPLVAPLPVLTALEMSSWLWTCWLTSCCSRPFAFPTSASGLALRRSLSPLTWKVGHATADTNLYSWCLSLHVLYTHTNCVYVLL